MHIYVKIPMVFHSFLVGFYPFFKGSPVGGFGQLLEDESQQLAFILNNM